jgi:hypothetical protein
MKLSALTSLFLTAAACAGPAAPPAFNAPAADGPVLCGTVLDPAGRPMAGVEVRPHGGFNTRFPGTSVRTDAQGHYRIHPVTGSLIGNEAGEWDLYVGVCVGTVENRNPAEFLPWQDVRVPQAPGTVVVLDFTYDTVAVASAQNSH